jgi:hypothetical protein
MSRILKDFHGRIPDYLRERDGVFDKWKEVCNLN